MINALLALCVLLHGITIIAQRKRIENIERWVILLIAERDKHETD